MKTNNYYPYTWIEYPVNYKQLGNSNVYEIACMDGIIVVRCNGHDKVLSVSKEKNVDNKLYLSLKRFKGKIARRTHFK